MFEPPEEPLVAELLAGANLLVVLVLLEEDSSAGDGVLSGVGVSSGVGVGVLSADGSEAVSAGQVPQSPLKSPQGLPRRQVHEPAAFTHVRMRVQFGSGTALLKVESGVDGLGLCRIRSQ